MKTKKKRLRIFFILLVILIAVLLIFFFGNRKEKIRHQVRPTGVAQATKPAKTVQMKKITLFFLSENDNLLHPEEREIQASSSVNEEAKEVIEELIKGPKSGLLPSIPENTRVRQVFVTSDGVAYVDLSRAVLEATYYGSTGEMAVVYSIVNSLAYNFKAIKKVSLLVEGNERETLGGHIDLTQPFSPDYSLIAR
ncbi:MAG: GerMN domain-containing protein [Candidatus Aminicenantes bacterium]|jgi:Spore germination protein|nr:GerMN domain-containing protein [Candidatus Aminicenantes bacterium]